MSSSSIRRLSFVAIMLVAAGAAALACGGEQAASAPAEAPSGAPSAHPSPGPRPVVPLLAPNDVRDAAPPSDAGSAGTTAVPSELAPVVGCTSTALVVLLDRSGSMSGAPMQMAKLAANASIDALGSDDCFGLIAFDSAPTRVVALARVTDATAMKAAVASVQAGGGTDLGPAMAAGRSDVRAATRAKHRAVLLLTDGQSASAGLREIAEAMVREGATLSTIGLGAGTDRVLLSDLATLGHGRSHEVRDPTTLPRVMVGEIGSVRASSAPLVAP